MKLETSEAEHPIHHHTALYCTPIALCHNKVHCISINLKSPFSNSVIFQKY